MTTSEAQLDNMGGIQKLWPVPVSSVNDFTDIYNSVIHNFVLTYGANVTYIYVIRDSVKFTEEKKDSADGTYFDARLEADAPSDRPELQEFIKTIEYTDYILIFQDNNGQYKVFGTPDEPLNVEAKLDTGQIEGALNCYQITFTRKLRNRSPFTEDFPIEAEPE